MVIIPPELLIYISEFNPEHRPRFMKCVEKIPLESIMFKCRRASNSFNEDIRKPYMIHLSNSIGNSIDEFEKALSIITTCNCCERHCTKRPRHLRDFDNVNIPFGNISQNKTCTCHCRNDARWMCRAAKLLDRS